MFIRLVMKFQPARWNSILLINDLRKISMYKNWTKISLQLQLTRSIMGASVAIILRYSDIKLFITKIIRTYSGVRLRWDSSTSPLSGTGFMFENWGTWPSYFEKYSRIIANLLYSNEIQIHWEFFSKIHQMALAMV